MVWEGGKLRLIVHVNKVIFLTCSDLGTKSSVFYRPAQLTAKHSFVFLEHVQMDNLQAVPPVQQPDDLLIYTPVPQIKVHYILIS